MQRRVLWGHHVDEYQAMFGLTTDDLRLRILEYGSGASAVNAELQGKASVIVSYDPWFEEDKEVLASMIEQSFNARMAQIEAGRDRFDLSRYGTFDALVRYRREGVLRFLDDYTLGKSEERYLSLSSTLTSLPDFSFDLALSAHYLFCDHDVLKIEHHLHVIRELARVAKEVRIFPLIDRGGVPSALLGPVLLGLQQNNFGVEVRDVSYYLQPKGNAMLRVWAQECKLS